MENNSDGVTASILPDKSGTLDSKMEDDEPVDIDEKYQKRGKDRKRMPPNENKIIFYGKDISIAMVSAALRSNELSFTGIAQHSKGKVSVYSDEVEQIQNMKWNSRNFNGSIVWTRRSTEPIPPMNGWINGEIELTENEICRVTGAVKVFKKKSGVKLVYASPHELYKSILMGIETPQYRKIEIYVPHPQECWKCRSPNHIQRNCTAQQCHTCGESSCLEAGTFCPVRRTQLREHFVTERENLLEKLVQWIKHTEPSLIMTNKKETKKMEFVQSKSRTWAEVSR